MGYKIPHNYHQNVSCENLNATVTSTEPAQCCKTNRVVQTFQDLKLNAVRELHHLIF